MLPDPLLDAVPDATLDLHGMTVVEARRAVTAFVRLWGGRKPGAVLHVITGKGRGSAGRPALRPAVRRMLRTELRPALADWTMDLDEGGFLLQLRRR
ncbi:MAG: Smr/MutS family protein [Gemmatimonadota bacterium]|nr:Smr/MutS family protein [Gemmatimonadota bacterium]